MEGNQANQNRLSGTEEKEKTMFYIIEKNYTGPNGDQHIDANTIEISNAPARGNMSGEIRLDGWCGTTNDWATYAHGEFETIEAARAAITEKFGEVRDEDANGDEFESDDEDVLEIFKPGKYCPMGSQETADWIFPGMENDVEATTTDKEISDLVKEYEAEANSEGYTLNTDAESFLISYRDELREELEDED